MSARIEDMLERERVANRRKHWVRAVTACNSRCLFCLDSDTPRNLFLPFEEVCAELQRGRDELGADKVIISGGEASLHPRFHDLVAHARAIGYERAQTVTNGWMFAERGFYEAALAAGLGEITFSLHGHTAELHDRLTQHPGSFHRLVKGLVRAVRHRKLIVNVDVVINKQNVAVLDRIVELAITLGVREFDLLSVIPQAAAWDHRDELFYDPLAHADVLRRVFRLNRHPGFTIWTNRFPLAVLEGLEDLIQDPHKMLDEVNGRRFQVRRYLDEGTPLDCRDAARCVHCFIEPFCDSMDDAVDALHSQSLDVIDLGRDHAGAARLRDGEALAYGTRALALHAADGASLGALALPPGPLLVRLDHVDAVGLTALPAAVELEVDDAGALAVALGMAALPVRVTLNRETAQWMLEHRDEVAAALGRLVVVQPTWERMEQAVGADVRDPASFFEALGLRVRVQGLPACLCPGARLQATPLRLPLSAFEADSGRLAIKPLAIWHVTSRYRARSARCADCVVVDRCDGLHVNMVRDQGFALARPLTGAWAIDAAAQLDQLTPSPPRRVAHGRAPRPVAPSLPGCGPPASAPEDPLGRLARDKAAARRTRRLEILG